MKCPECNGRGSITRRFLFITWQRPCLMCGGTGQISKAQAARAALPPDDTDDDLYRRRNDDYYPSPTDARSPGPEAFVADAAGRSGGAGGGASWGDDAPTRAEAAQGDSPLIVDPFTAEASEPAEAASSDSGWNDEAGGTSDSGTSGSGGTAY